jgi:DNA/RNA endonuclease G (NUC1)
MYLNEFIEIYICENGNTNMKKHVSFDTIFELEPRQYYIVIILTPPYNIEQNEFTIDVLSYPHEDKILDVSNTNTAVPGEEQKYQIKIEQIEHITPYDIIDKYKPNKHFILFKEFLFCGENVYTTLK